MSGKTPFFLSGGNARILVNNKTIAYATNVTYRVSVKHASPRVLGRFEVETIQPLAYEVTGTLSVYRYGRDLQSYFGEHAPESVNNSGNGVGSLGLSSALGAVGSALGFPTTDGQFDGGTNEAFNPARLFQSRMFNIEIRQNIPSRDGLGANKWSPKTISEATQNVGQALLDRVNDILVKDRVGSSKTETPVILLRDCRFEDMQFELDKRGVAKLNLTFRARYADDDTFIARKSGVGQEFS